MTAPRASAPYEKTHSAMRRWGLYGEQDAEYDRDLDLFEAAVRADERVLAGARLAALERVAAAAWETMFCSSIKHPCASGAAVLQAELDQWQRISGWTWADTLRILGTEAEGRAAPADAQGVTT